MFDTIFVPRGAEESAVRRAVARGQAPRIVATGIGPHAATRAAREALATAPERVLVTGLCGLLSPALLVGDALVYRDVRRAGGRPLPLDERLSDAVAARIPGAQTGIHGVDSERVVTSVADKATLAAEAGADAVDMETYAIARALIAAGARVAVVRIGSDGAYDDLPELDRALDGSGGLDAVALGLALLRRPRAGLRLARNATRALRALERAVGSLMAVVP